ncbi:MAG TPA: hypothetical protein VFK16_10135 [Gemmatimonadaceae bacterium]|jgi:hypothetical protein|nr:hypothetical protein [Gemmatimonadaceae bacterium]
MKAIRSLAAGVALLSAVPAVGMAQANRTFQNSWFWGVKGGGTVTSSRSKATVVAPMGGADWLITRNRGGIYFSIDQSFLSQYAVLADSVNPSDVPSTVNVKDLRRFTLALMGYPGNWERLHPYVGLGMVYSQVAQTTKVGAWGSAEQYNLAQKIIAAYKSAFAPVLLIGSQYQFRNTGVFVQASAWQANQQMLLSSPSHGINASLELGVRYNFGSSVDSSR